MSESPDLDIEEIEQSEVSYLLEEEHIGLAHNQRKKVLNGGQKLQVMANTTLQLGRIFIYWIGNEAIHSGPIDFIKIIESGRVIVQAQGVTYVLVAKSFMQD